MSYLYDLPFGRKQRVGGNMPAWMNVWARDWRVNGIVAGLALGTASFGVVWGRANSPRQVQLALKGIF